ncbi:MAG: HU family DNA-binding protein [Planctomycetaceae bacterium]|nr:HU family DNA-binding protein [Planctomycetaceae bacterium]
MAKKAAAAGKPMTKSEMLNSLAEANDMSRKEVSDFLDSLGELIGKNLSKKGPGVVNIPGLMKIKVVRKPATKERPGINPFTKEPTVFAAKPARNVVKITPLKGLKDMV